MITLLTLSAILCFRVAPYEAEYSTKDTSYGHAGRSKYGDDYDSGRSYVEKPTYNSYGDGDYGYGQGSCLEPKEFTVKGGFFKRNLKDRDEPTTTTEEEEVETVEVSIAFACLAFLLCLFFLL